MADKAGTVRTVEALVLPILEPLGLRLWDVRFEKEGPDWFLRVWIDRDEPLDTDACEAATRAINPVLDAADPIAQSYYLEVGSPGLGRRLTKDAHFEAKLGQEVLCHFIRPDEDGNKELVGTLKAKDGDTLMLTLADGTERTLSMRALSYVKLNDDADLFG